MLVQYLSRRTSLSIVAIVAKGLPNTKISKYLLWYGRPARQQLEGKRGRPLHKMYVVASSHPTEGVGFRLHLL
jgi:hypothetical protein